MYKSYAPFALQAVYPAITGVPWQWNRLLGRLISSGGGGVIHGYRHLAIHTCPSTTIRDSYATLCHSGETFMYLHLPYVAVLHLLTVESQPYAHCGPHLRLP